MSTKFLYQRDDTYQIWFKKTSAQLSMVYEKFTWFREIMKGKNRGMGKDILGKCKQKQTTGGTIYITYSKYEDYHMKWYNP